MIRCDYFLGTSSTKLKILRTESVPISVAEIFCRPKNEELWYLQSKPNIVCERFEPRSHFKSRLSLIVQVNLVLNRTVVFDSD